MNDSDRRTDQDPGDDQLSAGDKVKERARRVVEVVTPGDPEDRPPSPSGAGAPGYVHNDEVEQSDETDEPS